MISLDFNIDLHATPINDSTMPLEEEIDGIMEHLVQLVGTGCGITDPAVSLDEDLRLVTIEVSVEAETFELAVETASSCIRTAIHAGGGHTPGWTVEQRSQHAELAGA